MIEYGVAKRGLIDDKEKKTLEKGDFKFVGN